MKKSEPNYVGHRARLRDRFLKSGIQSMADYEAVELLLTLKIVDHLIVSADQVFSFRKAGLL